MFDVLVAGAGPAGSIAARQLALAGARVLIVDRETFPRDKLCGDTLNPGVVRRLDSIGLHGGPFATATPLLGMRVTGPKASVDAPYASGQVGASMSRRDLDMWLLNEAIAAGAQFEPKVTVTGALKDTADDAVRVRGLVMKRAGAAEIRVPAAVTIGADGRHSTVGRSVGIGSHPKPRRWAYGAYMDAGSIPDRIGVLGEMHVRAGWYCGIARQADGRANVCIVTSRSNGARDPINLIRTYLRSDRELAQRFADAPAVSDVSVLGPLAVDASSAGVPGLLLAGDAAGFVDPITGDGVNMAVQGAMMAANEAMSVLETGDWTQAIVRLNARRAQTLGPKERFNRAVRWLTASPTAVHVAGIAALAAPGLVRSIVAKAGDAA